MRTTGTTSTDVTPRLPYGRLRGAVIGPLLFSVEPLLALRLLLDERMLNDHPVEHQALQREAVRFLRRANVDDWMQAFDWEARIGQLREQSDDANSCGERAGAPYR